MIYKITHQYSCKLFTTQNFINLFWTNQYIELLVYPVCMVIFIWFIDQLWSQQKLHMKQNKEENIDDNFKTIPWNIIDAIYSSITFYVHDALCGFIAGLMSWFYLTTYVLLWNIVKWCTTYICLEYRVWWNVIWFDEW